MPCILGLDPDWASFFGRGTLDTAFNTAGYFGTKYAMTTYRSYVEALSQHLTQHVPTGPIVADFAPSGSAASVDVAAVDASAAAANLGIPPETLIDVESSSIVGDVFELAPLTAVEVAPGAAVAAGLGGASQIAASATIPAAAVGMHTPTTLVTNGFRVPPGVRSLLNSARDVYLRLIRNEARIRADNSNAMAARTVHLLRRNHPEWNVFTPEVVGSIQANPIQLGQSLFNHGQAPGMALSGSASIPVITSSASQSIPALETAAGVLSILPKARRRRTILGKKLKIPEEKSTDDSSISNSNVNSTPANTISYLHNAERVIEILNVTHRNATTYSQPKPTSKTKR